LARLLRNLAVVAQSVVWQVSAGLAGRR